MVFATVLSPRRNLLSMARSVCWLWFHLFQINLANQSYSVSEDAMNKPWRPVPSGRISVRDCRALRWTVVIVSWGLSYLSGFSVVTTSVLFSMLVIAHDDFRLSDYAISKNLCNAGGYASFELGATLVLCG
jgi:4-hydroxybenzoate polyprenyltransferase